MFIILRSDLEKIVKWQFVAGTWIIQIVQRLRQKLLKDLKRLTAGSTCRWKQVQFCGGVKWYTWEKHHSEFSLILCKILVSKVAITTQEDLRIIRHTSLKKVNSKINSNQKSKSDAVMGLLFFLANDGISSFQEIASQIDLLWCAAFLDLSTCAQRIGQYFFKKSV